MRTLLNQWVLTLGPLLEQNFIRALLISRGDVTVFVTRPISASLLALAAGLALLMLMPNFHSRREESFQE